MALIVMVVATVSHHLGLTEEIGRIFSKITKCSMCCSFWLTMFFMFIVCDKSLCQSILLSLLSSYASHWFCLLLIWLQNLYNFVWRKIQ